MIKLKNIFKKELLGKITAVFTASVLFVLFGGFYAIGLLQGYNYGKENSNQQFLDFLEEFKQKQKEASSFTPTQTNVSTTTPTPGKTYTKKDWGGPELWEEVNDKRIEYGVNPLGTRSELCTIASIRLNQLLALGTLDGHEGFSNMPEERPDLKWIFEKYSNVSEFLAYGGQSPEETVDLWDGTLGHKKLLDGGEYVWGCIYAQNTFAVAIAAY